MNTALRRSSVEKDDRVDIVSHLAAQGALFSDQHFVYASGKHGSAYINVDPIFPDVALMSEVCRKLAEPFVGEVDTVAAPATGGIVLAILTAQALMDGSHRSVDAVWADKHEKDFVIDRAGFVERIKGRAVLVVEDFMTTGGSVAKVCDEIRRLGGKIVAVSVLCNRGGITPSELGVPSIYSIANVKFESWEAELCPLCKRGVPIAEDIGHGAKFKHDYPDYHGGFVRLLSEVDSSING